MEPKSMVLFTDSCSTYEYVPEHPRSGKVINQANYLCGKWRKFFPGLCTLHLTHQGIRLARRPHLMLSLTLVNLRLPAS